MSCTLTTSSHLFTVYTYKILSAIVQYLNAEKWLPSMGVRACAILPQILYFLTEQFFVNKTLF